MKGAKERADILLVTKGLVESRRKAQALILAGVVSSRGRRINKPGELIDPGEPLEVQQPMPYVSRGGWKLEAALRHFQVDPQGWVCADVGASTGGFTDCLLQHGAARVYAIDVGGGQLDWKLRNNPRVVLRECVNARYLTPEHLPEPLQLAVIDVSFISVTLILPSLVPFLAPDGQLIILIKPQFEVGREQVGKGGVVRDPALHQAACDRVAGAVGALGFRWRLTESPILGAEGNREFLLHASR
jgi:23S rRNA (cytidine1920-2'-O)/16S rRNA (cytidine1409-2'-O)-methyltransferase